MDGFQFLKDKYQDSLQDISNFKIIDLATLTGACVVALGKKTAGIFGNRDELIEELVDSGKKTFE